MRLLNSEAATDTFKNYRFKPSPADDGIVIYLTADRTEAIVNWELVAATVAGIVPLSLIRVISPPPSQKAAGGAAPS